MKHIPRERVERLEYKKSHLWTLTDREQELLDRYHAARAARYRFMVAVVFAAAVLLGLVLR